MSEISQYIASLENIIILFPNFIDEIIENNSGKILSMVKLRLFNKGVDGSGSKISPLYAPSTIVWKKLKKQTTSHVTLRDSGNLYKTMFVEYKNNNIFIDTTVEYKQELIDKYGEDIFNLTIQEIEVIIFSFIEPEVQKLLNTLPNISIEI